MKPEFATNRPERDERVADAVKDLFATFSAGGAVTVDADVATAYFNVGGWVLIRAELKAAGKVRLLLGAEPQRDTVPVTLRNASQTEELVEAAQLSEALVEQESGILRERDHLPFTRQARADVMDLIGWLESRRVEVKRYADGFLHGKAYLVRSAHDKGVVAGSSNFTYAGLARNRELNLGQYNPTPVGNVQDWFDELWTVSDAYPLADYYRQQVLPEEPWLVFLRMLWAAYGDEVTQAVEADDADPSMRKLTEFQKDGVWRARRILDEYQGVLVADEVGLGKTFVAGALIKDAKAAKQRTLIIAPKVIRDRVWREDFLDKEQLKDWADAISYDDLLTDNFGLPAHRDTREYGLVVLDEAHTVRNKDTQRAQALIKILSDSPRKNVALLTATPVNNALADLHNLLSYFIIADDEFADMNIPSLSAHFAALERLGDEELAPEQLFDILDAVALRRTRRFVRNHYAGRPVDDSGIQIKFPEPIVKKVEYDLTPVMAGFFEDFAYTLGVSDDDVDDDFFAGEIPAGGLCTKDGRRLTFAGYTPSRYRLDGDTEQYEIQVAGLLRSGLLKRFESSGYAFGQTCFTMADTLRDLQTMIRNDGLVASSSTMRDYLKIDTEDVAALDEWKASADVDSADAYAVEALLADIENDEALLRDFGRRATEVAQADLDPKITALGETLVRIIKQAELDSVGVPDQFLDNRKVLVFSYFTDTLAYLRTCLPYLFETFPALKPYRGRIGFVAGSGSRSGLIGDAILTQDQAVVGFAPKTAAPTRKDGTPAHDDRYDLLFTTDVLSEGVNLQQARNIINYDLPWNPMRLVQRHGRIDRIGSKHGYNYLWCFFPDQTLDVYLGLEARLHRKIIKAARSIGVGTVIPGSETSERTFGEAHERIKAVHGEDNAIFLGEAVSLISGEEFRATLRQAIVDHSLQTRLERMPGGIGSGFTADRNAYGLVFCAKILNRDTEPYFRWVPLPEALIPGYTGHPDLEPGPTAEPSAQPAEQTDSNDGGLFPDPRPRQTALDDAPPSPLPGDPVTVTIRGHAVPIVGDSLSALTNARPAQDQATPPHLPEPWIDLAFDAWEAVQADIQGTWNRALDPTQAPPLDKAFRDARKHLRRHADHRHDEDVDYAAAVYGRNQAPRIRALVRAVLTNADLTDALKTDRLIEIVEDNGLKPADTRAREPRQPVSASDVHLIAWMAVIPPTDAT